MVRHRFFWFLLVILFLTSLACNAFAGNPRPAFEPPPTIIAEATSDETGEMAATATFPVEEQGTPAKAKMLVDLNIRSGPGVQYDRIGFLLEDDEAAVLGRHQESGWLLIECPDNVSAAQCWVSGGDQYTQVEGAESIPTVEAPPTPTPIPPEFEDGTGIVVYSDSGFLYALLLDLTQDLPQPLAEPVLLADSVSVQSLSISPDGRRAAYVAGSAQANALYVVNTNGQDQRRLVVSEELPLSGDRNAADYAVIIDQIAWKTDNQTILFNTGFTNLVGAGSGSQEDLWSVTLDGQAQELFPAGDGAGAFVIASNDQLLLSRADNIARANLNGSNQQIVLQFDFINTASETIYYPLPQVIRGNARVGIPAAQPFLADAQTTLWEISGQGRAVQLGAVDGSNLFSPVNWSGDGERLAYIRPVFDPDAPQPTQLVIADGMGINMDTYAAGEMLVFHDWGPDNRSFVYSGIGFYTVGRQGAPPVQTLLAPGQVMLDAQWITDTAFLSAVGPAEGGDWELRSADRTGAVSPLAEIQSQTTLFDLWPVP